MQTPVQITFRHVDPSPAVEARVRKLAEHLDHYYDRITGCHVVIEGPATHRHKGAPYSIHIDVVVPGGEIFVNSERDLHEEHADVYVALRDAFDSTRRQLEDYARRYRQDVKRHETPQQTGTISELNAADGFGRIETDDGRLIYFHRNSVHDAKFEQLELGEHVRFEAEQGDEGPQAVAVRVL